MESQFYIEYEIANPATSKATRTESREEAPGYFDEDYLITEYHVTITKYNEFESSRQENSTVWNNNPFYDPLEDRYDNSY